MSKLEGGSYVIDPESQVVVTQETWETDCLTCPSRAVEVERSDLADGRFQISCSLQRALLSGDDETVDLCGDLDYQRSNTCEPVVAMKNHQALRALKESRCFRYWLHLKDNFGDNALTRRWFRFKTGENAPVTPQTCISPGRRVA